MAKVIYFLTTNLNDDGPRIVLKGTSAQALDILISEQGVSDAGSLADSFLSTKINRQRRLVLCYSYSCGSSAKNPMNADVDVASTFEMK